MISTRCPTLRSWAALLVLVAHGAEAQERAGPLTDRVVDAADRPISAALVFVDDAPETGVRTGDDGTFRLEGVTTGIHRLSFRKRGFAPRSLRYTVAAADDREIGVVAEGGRRGGREALVPGFSERRASTIRIFPPRPVRDRGVRAECPGRRPAERARPPPARTSPEGPEVGFTRRTRRLSPCP